MSYALHSCKYKNDYNFEKFDDCCNSYREQIMSCWTYYTLAKHTLSY